MIASSWFILIKANTIHSSQLFSFVFHNWESQGSAAVQQYEGLAKAIFIVRKKFNIYLSWFISAVVSNVYNWSLTVSNPLMAWK